MKVILEERSVDEEVLATVLTEVEATLNSRPLCAVSHDPNDLQPLSPNQQLLNRAVHSLRPDSFVKEDVLVRNKWRQTHVLVDHFWNKWLKEYIKRETEITETASECIHLGPCTTGR